MARVHISYMAYNKLTKLFEDAAFGEFDIGYTDNRETIILRDEEKDEVEYTDKTHIKANASGCPAIQQAIGKDLH